MRAFRCRGSRTTTVLVLLSGMVFVALPLSAQDSRLHGEFTRSLTVSKNASLTLKNPNGRTTVRVGSGDEVRIVSTISAGTKWDCDRESSERKVWEFEENHALEREGDDIRIGAWPDPEMARCTMIEYELRVPADLAIRIEQRYGDVKVYDVHAPIDIETEAGSTRIKDPGAQVSVKLGAGTINVAGSPRDDWRLKIDTGSVEVRLPKDAGFDVDAEARDGGVHSDFPLNIRKRGGSTFLLGSANGGGPRIEITTDMAGIEILER